MQQLVAKRSGMWIGEVKRGPERGQRFHVEAVEWMIDRANLQVVPKKEKNEKNED